MTDKLYINRWSEKRKNITKKNQTNGLNFISAYSLNDYKRVLKDLWKGLLMINGSKTSRYINFITPNDKEVIKLRISNFPSNENEWSDYELTGLPNRRYSIVIFSSYTMPTEYKKNIKELNWKNYSVLNIPVFEKTINRYYLKETFDNLKMIISDIFQGKHPEDV